MSSESRRNAFAFVNSERRKHGLQSLVWSPILAKSSQAAAKVVERDKGPLRHSATWWMQIYKYGGKKIFGEIGECLGEGQKDSLTVVNAWINSPPHNKVMNDGDVTHGGIGHYGDSWCLHTGEKR